MKKVTTALCAVMIVFSGIISEAAYSQKDIYDSLSSACTWMDRNASPLKNPDSAAADYFIMALARMNKSYDFDSFSRLADTRTSSTYRDGQRVVMAKTACGAAVPESQVKDYTYDINGFDSLTDLANAIITIDCGKYAVEDDEKSKDELITDLLASQHSDGSFSSDCYTTALAIIALAPYNGLNYNTNGGDAVSYSVQSALLNAVSFLENSKDSNFGYSSVRTTAFAIIALDSVGIDADNDAGFSDNGKSPLNWLVSKQELDGSFNSAAEDTAFALCALTSHLRAMQGRSAFFSFSEKDPLNLDASRSGASENRSGSGLGGAETQDETSEAPSYSNKPAAPDKVGSGVFATPVPTSEKSGGNHMVLALSLIFTTVIFIGICTYIVIRFKFPDILCKFVKKSDNDDVTDDTGNGDK